MAIRLGALYLQGTNYLIMIKINMYRLNYDDLRQVDLTSKKLLF